MGKRGVQVAKDAADILLLDDDFQSIVLGMEQGRLSSDNLQKSIMYTLCSKVPQVAPTFAELVGVPQALTVAQVLLIDIGTDIWTAIAYAIQPPEAKLMQRPPRHPRIEKMVNWKVLLYSYGYIGPLQMISCWLMFIFIAPGTLTFMRTGKLHHEFNADEEFMEKQGMTVYYWTLVFGQVAAAVSTTTKTQSVFFSYGFPNNALNICLVCEIVLGLACMYNGFLASIFELAPLSPAACVIPAVTFFLICGIEEGRKSISRSMESSSDKVFPQQAS